MTAPSMLWSYNQLKQHLEQQFGQNSAFEQIQNDLFKIKRKPGQRLHEFYDEIAFAADGKALSAQQPKN